MFESKWIFVVLMSFCGSKERKTYKILQWTWFALVATKARIRAEFSIIHYILLPLLANSNSVSFISNIAVHILRDESFHWNNLFQLNGWLIFVLVNSLCRMIFPYLESAPAHHTDHDWMHSKTMIETRKTVDFVNDHWIKLSLSVQHTILRWSWLRGPTTYCKTDNGSLHCISF